MQVVNEKEAMGNAIMSYPTPEITANINDNIARLKVEGFVVDNVNVLTDRNSLFELQVYGSRWCNIE